MLQSGNAETGTRQQNALTLAILGAGNTGSCLGKAFRRVPGVNIKYVFSRQFARARELAQELGCAPSDQTGPIFADDEVEGVVICLPTSTRGETLRDAVRTQKHIFCEKPLALNPPAGSEIGRLLRGYSKTVAVGHVVRFFWEYSRIHEMVLSGALGEISMVRLSRCVGFPGADSWFADVEKSGGVILDLLVHDIDFLLWTFGDVKQVYANGLTHSSRPGQLDYALLNVHMESGALAHLEGSWAHPVGSFYQSAEICGSRGVLHYDSRASKGLEWTPTTPDAEKTPSRVALPKSSGRDDPYFLEVRDFVHCVRTGRRPAVGVEEALKACEVAFLAIESTKQGVALKRSREG